jgi:phosphoglycolate phosphatase
MLNTKPNRLVVFDCDGTLVDSQHHIVDCMAAAFGEHGLAPPAAEAVRAVVGLSLAEAIGRLVPVGVAADLMRLTESYKRAFFALRQRPGMLEPLYDGVAATIEHLVEAGFLLGVATGKSRRGLDAVLAGHGLAHHFVTLQTVDSAPGKPDPTMLRQAIAEAGAAPETAVMIGDTTFDMEMAVRAGVPAIGVAWGYHPPDALQAAGAAIVVDRCSGLASAVEQLIGSRA